MARKNVADLLVDVLAETGVPRIYGVSGDSLNGITDSIRASKRMYSCPNAMLLVLGFPPSSLAGIVEIRSLFLLHVCGTVTRRRLPAATNEAN